MNKSGNLRWAAMIALAMACGHAAGNAPDAMPLQFLHRSWTEEAGRVLPPVRALVQEPDGYLWLGTHEGLIHFDGMRFAAWEPHKGEQLPGGEIRILIPSRAGGFWVGTDAGLCRLVRGHVVTYPQADQLLKQPVYGLMEDSAGDLWVLGQRNGLTTLAALRANGSVQVYGAGEGVPAGRLFTLYRNREGGLWLGTTQGLCAWRPGSPAQCYGPSVRPVSITGDSAGGLLVIDGGSAILSFRDGEFRPVEVKQANLSVGLRSVMRDRDGNVWITTPGQGVLCLRRGRIERFQRRDGLSSNAATAMIEDREGNVWIATDRGIDRLRDPAVTRISSEQGLSSDLITTVAAIRNGDVWMGTFGAGVNRDRNGVVTSYSTSAGLPGAEVLALHADSRGRLWAGTHGGPAYWSGDRFVAVPPPAGSRWGQTFAITSNPRGELFAADTALGLLAIREGSASRIAIPGAKGKGIYRLRAVRSGDLWAGFYQGGAALLRNGEPQFFTPEQGMAGGPVLSIYEDSSGSIWIGARLGLSRFRNGVWTTWGARDGMVDPVQSILEDAEANLWILSPRGLLRVPLEELNRTVDGAPRPLKFTRFGLSAGLAFAHESNMTGPHLAHSPDGRIWIPTGDGVAVVEPARIHGNPTAPVVMVEEISRDGKPVDFSGVSTPSIRGREIGISYTGISMAAPEEVRFKYHMDGLDQRGEWHDAAGRRNVAYVNLTPGWYQFRVIASNSDGVWNMQGASLPFQLAPYFYQTGWFAAACGVALSLLIWGLHRLNLRRVEYNYRLAAQERTRLTREMHDSLLQGFAGVVYQLEAVSKQLEIDPEKGRRKLEHAIEQADQALLETRRTLMSMRLPALENRTLPEALGDIGEKLAQGTPAAFHLSMKGTVRVLGYDEQANFFLIGREAITNAVNHANAHRIQAQLTYSSTSVRLVVKDDGTGFDTASTAPREDHWGLAGMQERAADIGAEFTIESTAGKGTWITVTLEDRSSMSPPMRFLRAVGGRDTISS